MSRKHVTKVVFEGKDKTAGATKSFALNMENANAAVTKALGKYGALAGAAGAAAAGIYRVGRSAYEFTARMAESGDRVSKLSYRLGMTAAALSEVEYIGKRAGVSVETMGMAMQRMTRRVAEAAHGFGEARGALSELGLDAKQLSLLSPDQQFYRIAEALQEVNRQNERIRLARGLFDSEGIAVLQTLEENIGDVRARFRQVGGGMSDDFARNSARFTSAANDVSTAWAGLKQDFSEPFIIAGASDMEDLAELLGGIRHSAVGARAALSSLGGPLGSIFALWGPRNRAAGSDVDSMFGDFLASGGPGNLVGESVPSSRVPRGPRNYDAAPDPGERMPWWRRTETDEEISLFPVDGQEDMTRGIDVVMDRMAEFGDGLDDVSSRWSSMGNLVAGSVADNMSAAFDRVLWYGQDVADAIGQMFKDTFSSILSGLFRVGVGAGLNYISPGLGTALGFTTLGKRASGGPVTGGRPYIVGENGPELYVPQGSGSIVPNHAMGGSRTFNVNITAQDMSDPMHLRRLAKKLIQAIQDEEGYYYAGASA